MARKLSLSPTPSNGEQLGFPGIDSRKSPGDVPVLDLRLPDARSPARAPRLGAPRSSPESIHPVPPVAWRLPRGVRILDEIITCAVIVLIFLTIALPLFRWIAR